MLLLMPSPKMKGVPMELGTVPAVMAPPVKRLISVPTVVLADHVTNV
jgi:hypothetical protein